MMMLKKTLFVLLSLSSVVAFAPSEASSSSQSRVSSVPSLSTTTAAGLFAANKNKNNLNNNDNNNEPDDEQQQQQQETKSGFFAGFSNFMTELDNFMDDASARRLGAGASFYGKRKSKFYGSDDKMRKQTDGYDPTEDYRVTAGGNYKWMEDEDGVMRPVTRLKKKIMERN